MSTLPSNLNRTFALIAAVIAVFTGISTAQASAESDYCRNFNSTYTLDAYTPNAGGGYNFAGSAYKVQLIQPACWNGSEVRLTANPDYRVYNPVTPNFTAIGITGCSIVGASPVNVKASSVTATCQVTVTNYSGLL